MEEFSQLPSSIQGENVSSSSSSGRPSRKQTSSQRYEPYDELRDNSVSRKKKKSTTSFVKGPKSSNDSMSDAPFKRPRGRPPLTFKKTNSTSSVDSTTIPTIPSSYNANNYAAYNTTISSTSSYLQDNIYSNQSSTAVNNNDNVSTKETEKEGTEKALKVSASQVTQRIIARLMTENPLEMSEIVRGLPDVPKDLVQSCIDTAQILGIVIAVQLNNDNAECADLDANTLSLVTDNNNNNDDNNKIVNEDDEFEANNDTNVDADPNAITTSAITSNTTTTDVLPAVKIEESNNLTIDNTSIITDFSDIPLNSLLRKDIDDPRKKKKKYSDGNIKQRQKRSKIGNMSPIGNSTETVYYTIAGFGKCSESVDMRNITTSTESKISKTKAIKDRIKLLEEISTQQMSSTTERTLALTNFLEQILASDSSLYGDHVYRFMIENVYSK